MTIIVFLVDTSASMQQKAFVSGRSTLLDVAKGAVEFFVKMRQKSPESRLDRYMLLSFEEFPKNIKAGWKENLQTFMNELKNLEAMGMTTMGSALKQVFDTLNINRMQTGIDMYGQGRYPFYLEPAVIIVISDGGKLTTQGTVQHELNLPMHSSVPGSELTREPFRWDQRLYALVLRMSGTPTTVQETGHVASDHSPIDAMCEVTGGRSYAVTSHRVLHQCIDSLVQKLQSGVVINFDKLGADPPPPPGMDKQEEEEGQLARADTAPLDDLEALNAKGLTFKQDGGSGSNSNSSRPHTPNATQAATNNWHSCRKLIYVPRSAQKGFAVGFWPLPESFWPDSNAPSLPTRSAHPKVNFTCTNQEPLMIENLPFDKYELEPSPLTLYILARKQPKVCWQVYIQGSSKVSESGHPFGYLKASTNLLSVNLFVLPYNFPILLPLLEDLFKVHRLKPSNDWRTQFHNYLRTMPAYYAGPLRRALTRMGAGNLATSLIPETMDNCLSYQVMNYLKRLKNQAKIEYDKTLTTTPIAKQRLGPDGIKITPRSPFKKELLSNHTMRDKFNPLKDQLTDFPGFMLGIKDSSMKSNSLRNPFDISRKNLLDQLVRMRANYLQPSIHSTKLLDDDTTHSLPIGQMGNYQDYLKKMPVPLREIESQPVRQHMFGNPFKINKNMILDEIVDEIGMVGGGSSSSSGGLGGSSGEGGGVTPPRKGIKRSNPDGGLTPSIPGLIGAKRGRKGPLPKDYVFKRTPPGTPSPSPRASPHHEMEDSKSFDITPAGLPSQVNPLLSIYSGSNNRSSSSGTAVGSTSHFQPPEGGSPLTPPATTGISSSSPAAPAAISSSSSSISSPTPQQDVKSEEAPAVVNGSQSPSPRGTSSNPEELDDTDSDDDHHSLNIDLGHQQHGSYDLTIDEHPVTGSGVHDLQHHGVSYENDESSSHLLPPANYSPTPSPGSASGGSSLLSRSESFRLNQAQDHLMSHEIAGVLGSGASGNGHPGSGGAAINGRSPSSSTASTSATNGAAQPPPPSSSAVLVNGLLNGSSSRSRDQSPVNNVINQDQQSTHAPSAHNLSKDELRRVKNLNQNMRQLIYKEVKRPGKNHQKLFEMLKRDLHGPRQVRRDYLQEVIKEALRFKRRNLAELLEKNIEDLITQNGQHVLGGS